MKVYFSHFHCASALFVKMQATVFFMTWISFLACSDHSEFIFAGEPRANRSNCTPAPGGNDVAENQIAPIRGLILTSAVKRPRLLLL